MISLKKINMEKLDDVGPLNFRVSKAGKSMKYGFVSEISTQNKYGKVWMIFVT